MQQLSLVFILYIQYSFGFFYAYLECNINYICFIDLRVLNLFFLYISCYVIALSFPALFFVQKCHTQMFLRLRMSFLMDSKLEFSYEYLFSCYLKSTPVKNMCYFYLVGLFIAPKLSVHLSTHLCLA